MFSRYDGYSWNSCTSCLFSLFSNITVRGDVTFADNVCTSISAYSSDITLSGNISFLNNAGTNGGAMALYLSTLSFAFGANVYFYSNTAMEAGGAIYVDKNYNNLRLVDGAYLPPCFYRILRVTTSDWLNISFYNNSATKGRNDIYGEFMHSGGCDTGDDTNRYSIVVPSCNVQTFFPLSCQQHLFSVF